MVSTSTSEFSNQSSTRSARARSEFTFQVANFICTSRPGHIRPTEQEWRTYSCTRQPASRCAELSAVSSLFRALLFEILEINDIGQQLRLTRCNLLLRSN